jgi:hypothetical protein
MSYQARPHRNDKAGSIGSSERSREHVPTAPGTKEWIKIYQNDICCETHLHSCVKRGSGWRSRQHVLHGAPTMLHGRDNGPGVFSPLGRPDKTVHTTSGNTRHVWLLRLPRNLDIHTTCTLRSKVLGPWNDHLHIVAATLMVASWELWIFCSFFFYTLTYA